MQQATTIYMVETTSSWRGTGSDQEFLYLNKVSFDQGRQVAGPVGRVKDVWSGP